VSPFSGRRRKGEQQKAGHQDAPCAAVSHIHISPFFHVENLHPLPAFGLIEQNIVAKSHAGEVVMNGALLTAFLPPAR
jgi:hypothetical protein